MEQLNELLDLFQTEIEKTILHQKIVIGGIWALRLHGLITRQPNDLDIIIYDPIIEFEEYLESLIKDKIAKDGQEDDEEEPYRSYKIEKDEHEIDFLLERNIDIPNNLLRYDYKGIIYYVQSIFEVFKAKTKYGEREKDINDCIKLKKDNFNLLKTPEFSIDDLPF